MKLLRLALFFVVSSLQSMDYPAHHVNENIDESLNVHSYSGAYISFEANWFRCKEKKDRFACAEVQRSALDLWVKLCRKGPVECHLRDEEKICKMAEEATLMFLLKPKNDSEPKQ